MLQKVNQKSQYLNVLNHETKKERKYVVFASENIIQVDDGIDENKKLKDIPSLGILLEYPFIYDEMTWGEYWKEREYFSKHYQEYRWDNIMLFSKLDDAFVLTLNATVSV